MPFQIIRNDITKVEADAIVNTANPKAAVGAGVDSAIYKAAGYEKLLEARRKIGELMPGEVGVTKAFALKAKYIIHVSGPVWENGTKGEAEILRHCYDEALKQAYERGCRSVAFPLISTGTYGFPKELGLQIAVDAFTAFLEEYEMDITLAVFAAGAVRVSGKLADEIKSYIDDEDVRRANREEYRFATLREVQLRRANAAALSSDFLGEPGEETPEERTCGHFRFNEDTKDFVADEEAGSELLKVCESQSKYENASIDDVLKKIYKESFGKYLQKLINKKGLKNSEVYAAANISKQYFSKLLKDQVKPSKEKVLALAVGLRLNTDETADFLKLAGYALSPISQTDRVVEFFIEHEDYSVIKINIVLFDYGLAPLSH